jgi:hypothetical protein
MLIDAEKLQAIVEQLPEAACIIVATPSGISYADNDMLLRLDQRELHSLYAGINTSLLTYMIPPIYSGDDDGIIL